MATASARNFSNYSGIQRQQQMQQMPSATERLQDPLKWGPGTDRDRVLKDQFSWALPLSDRPATPVGRSTRDPSRALEMLSRGTARPGQVQAALALDRFKRLNQDPVDQALGLGAAPAIPQSVGQPLAPFADRRDNVNYARQNGTLPNIQQTYNQYNMGRNGSWMDQHGNIFGNRSTPAIAKSTSAIQQAFSSPSNYKAPHNFGM